MRWWTTWLWLQVLLALKGDAVRTINWSNPRIKAAVEWLSQDGGSEGAP